MKEKPVLDFEFNLNKFLQEGEESSQAAQKFCAEEFRPVIRKMKKKNSKFY